MENGFMNLLVVEDDKELNRLVCSYLENSGYNVTSCFDGLDAWEQFCVEPIDFVLTDIMMPKMDGFELARKIREKDGNVPILFMTARDDKPSKQLGFKLGIDDYITKPFDLDELVLRVGAILRRLGKADSKTLTVGNLTMDLEEHTAYLNGEEMPLTVREFDLLYKFISTPKKTFTRSQLM